MNNLLIRNENLNNSNNLNNLDNLNNSTFSNYSQFSKNQRKVVHMVGIIEKIDHTGGRWRRIHKISIAID